MAETCSERSTTVALASGMLRSQDIAQAQAHVASCVTCRTLLSEAGTAPTVRLEDSKPATAPLVDATMTAHDRPSQPPARVSRPFIGKYRIVGKLGAGGMGEVYEAEDPELDRRIAIKLLHGTSETADQRLVREARALAKLRHPNVVTIYEVGRDAGDAFVAMELVEGETLRQWMRGEHTLEERLEVLIQAGRGLAAAHAEELIHRDFKPENVMVGADGRVQVLDFGLAKSATIEDDAPATTTKPKRTSGESLDAITRTGTLLGTPAYMAPEQFAAAATDARTDQFAFCVALFESIHGFRPFAGATQADLADAVFAGKLVDRPRSPVPPHVQAAIERGLAVEPAARFADMNALLAALTLRGGAMRGRRWVIALAAAAVLAGVAVVIAARVTGGSKPAGAAAPNADEALFARSNVPAAQPAPIAGDPFKVTVHRLSNGLTVYISPNRKSPRVETRLVVRAGSRDANGIGGLAHMVEHMTYKGTSRVGTLDFARETPHLTKLRELYAAHARATTPADKAKLLAAIDTETVEAARFANPAEVTDAMSSLGVRGYSASTDRDATVFSADVPSNKFGLWAKLEGERLSGPVFRTFHVEAGVVFDEIHQRRSSGAMQAMYDDLLAAAFGDHPYGKAPGGTLADIVDEPATAAEAFYASWYVPNNAALLLAGDIDPEQAIPALERELGRWRPRELPPRKPVPVAPIAGDVQLTVKGMEVPLAMVGWRAVPFGHPDGDALVALGALIDHLAAQYAGRARLGLGPWPLIDAGMLVASVVPVSGHTQQDAIAVLDEIIHTVQAGQFSDETLAAVLLNTTLGYDRAHDSNGTRLDRMAVAYLGGRGWPHQVGRKARVAALTKADLVRVANTYFTKQRVSIVSEVGPYQMPAVQAPKITPIEVKASARSTFVNALLAEETVDIPPRFVSEGRDYFVGNTAIGPVIAVANTEDDQYVMRLRWELGSRRLPLLCAALHALDHAGIGDGDAAARRSRWFARAQTAQISCQADIVEIEVTGVDASFDAGWEDVERWLAGGGITDAVWQAGSGEYLDVRAWGRSGDAIIGALDQYAAFGAASEYLAVANTAALKRATAADARAALQTLVTTPRTIAYFGPRKVEAVHLPAAVAVTRPPATRTPARLAPITATRIVAVDTGANRAVNATIRISLGRRDIPALATATVFANYLTDAGGGVLFNAFRNIRGITYSGGMASVDEAMGPDDDSSLVIRFATTAEQLPKALSIALGIVRDSNIQRDQATAARRRTEEMFRANWIPPRDLPVMIAYWRAQGLQADPRGPMFEHTLRTSERELAKLAGELAAAPTYITITGDVSAIDRAQLQAFGSVENAAAASLFAP